MRGSVTHAHGCKRFGNLTPSPQPSPPQPGERGKELGRVDMTDADALLAAIDADPDADGPRLVYADFLDDARQHAHAEFIRLQCTLAHLPPASAAAGRLWERIGPVWARLEDDWYPARWCGWGTGDTTDSLDAVHFWRGVLRPHVVVPLATLVECAHPCRSALPLPGPRAIATRRSRRPLGAVHALTPPVRCPRGPARLALVR